MEDQIPQFGPKEVVIPEQRYLSCHGCKFYAYRMLISGLDPKYGNSCENPHIPDMHRLNVPTNLRNGDKTPYWCPYLNTEEK